MRRRSRGKGGIGGACREDLETGSAKFTDTNFLHLFSAKHIEKDVRLLYNKSDCVIRRRKPSDPPAKENRRDADGSSSAFKG